MSKNSPTRVGPYIRQTLEWEYTPLLHSLLGPVGARRVTKFPFRL